MSSTVDPPLAFPQAATGGREEVFIMRCIPISAANRTFATGVRGLVGIVAMVVATAAVSAEPLAGTKPLTLEGDITAHLLDGAHKFVDREIERSVERRIMRWEGKIPPPVLDLWLTGFGGGNINYQPDGLENQRERLARYLGVPYSHHGFNPLSNARLVTQKSHQIPSASDVSPAISIHHVTWDVAQPSPTGPMLKGYGIYLRPKNHVSTSYAIICVDANQSPDSIWDEDATLLASQGCHVFIPYVLNRETHGSLMLSGERRTDLTHREYVYRQAFEAGRSIVGYEASTILALLENLKSFTREPFKENFIGESKKIRVAILGKESGGQTALLTGALSRDIETTVVADHFGNRHSIWQESPENNTWGRLDEFGDAELARMILAKRRLVIEAPEQSRIDELVKTAPRAAPGKLIVPSQEDAERELLRVPTELRKSNLRIHSANRKSNRSFSDASLQAVVHDLGLVSPDQNVTFDEISNVEFRPKLETGNFGDIQSRLVAETSTYTQALIHESEYVRRDFMKDADRKSRDPAKWHASVEQYRKYFYDEVIGRFEHDLKPFNAQTRQVYDTDKYRGYEVTLDVFDDVIAYGVLLVPKDIKPGEQRPVVVCQHGLEGRPQDTIEKDLPGERYYHQFAAKLAERGFVTFAPQNLYIFKDRFRELQRKLNPLKKTLFSLIVPQHEQICRWLKSQPFVDGSRIGFYGLSYGGKTAMRVPPLVDHYSCVICSGDFNDWIRKCTSIRDPFSYVGTGEYEIWEWNLANTFNYAEMAGLICPRPFMVERGHRDGVGLDSWVDYEYAKVRLLYVDLKIPERTEIEHFDGPHEINGVGSYKFLHKHLNWPEPK